MYIQDVFQSMNTELQSLVMCAIDIHILCHRGLLEFPVMNFPINYDNYIYIVMNSRNTVNGI